MSETNQVDETNVATEGDQDGQDQSKQYRVWAILAYVEDSGEPDPNGDTADINNVMMVESAVSQIMHFADATLPIQYNDQHMAGIVTMEVQFINGFMLPMVGVGASMAIAAGESNPIRKKVLESFLGSLPKSAVQTDEATSANASA